MIDLSKFNWFILIWAVIGLFGAIYFRLSIPPALKQKRLNSFNLVVPVIFLIACFIESQDWSILFLMMPALFLITLINSRVIKICQKCGSLQYGNTWKLSPPKTCFKCSADFPKPLG